MDNGLDRFAIAERIRRLVHAPGRMEMSETAARLRVGESALRSSIDERSPQPAIEVIAAIVREYGVDPSWLLTGVYDASTHHLALDEERAGVVKALQAVAGKVTPARGWIAALSDRDAV